MIHGPKELIWQSRLTTERSIGTFLNPRFAQRCRMHPVSVRGQIAKLAWQDLGINGTQPSNLIDYTDGILPKGFYLNRGGIWLTVDARSLDPGYPLTFSSHNADSIQDQLYLLRLFGSWADYAALAVQWE